MKKDIHPEYREVVFKDPSSDFEILTRSTVQTTETIRWQDGKEYPLVVLDISSGSHPFYTGKQRFVDTAGRIDRLTRKFGSKVALGNQSKRKVVSKAGMSIKDKLRQAAQKKEGQPEADQGEK